MFFVSTRVTCTLNITCHYFITLSIYEALHCTIFSNLPLLSLSDVQLYSLIPCSRIPPHPVLEHFNTLFSNTSTPCSRTPQHPALQHLNLCPSLHVISQVSHPYKTISKIIVTFRNVDLYATEICRYSLVLSPDKASRSVSIL